MKPVSWTDLLEMLRGEIHFHPQEGGRGASRVSGVAPATGAAIDSRRVETGRLFFALPGTRLHGVHYVPQAVEGDTAGIVVERRRVPDVMAQLQKLGRTDIPTIAVTEPARALGRLAEEVRRREASSLPAASITGSVGKTTTCRYVSDLLGRWGVVQRPPASFNNHLGVPLTILNAPDPCRFLVIEVGTNQAGEVHRLANWSRPHIAAITAVAPVHLSGFGTLEAIEAEKLSILDALDADGIGWIPTSLAERHRALLKSCDSEIRTFGPGGDLQIISDGILGKSHTLLYRPQGIELTFDWPAPFPHSPRNLECALAVAHSFGVPLVELIQELDALRSAPLRGEVQRHHGVEFLLDCYNASPASVESAITRLEHEPTKGRRVCVIGTMEELGDGEIQWHEHVGNRLARANFDSVYLVGRGGPWYADGMRGGGCTAQTIEKDQRSAERLARDLQPGDRVLFKASRTEALESFAANVAEAIGQGRQGH